MAALDPYGWGNLLLGLVGDKTWYHTNEDSGYFMWGNGEPDGTGEECTNMRDDLVEWYDHDCTLAYGFICEKQL